MQSIRHLFRLFLATQILFEQGRHGFFALLGADFVNTYLALKDQFRQR